MDLFIETIITLKMNVFTIELIFLKKKEEIINSFI